MKRNLSTRFGFTGGATLAAMLAILRELSSQSVSDTWRAIIFIGIIAALVILGLAYRGNLR